MQEMEEKSAVNPWFLGHPKAHGPWQPQNAVFPALFPAVAMAGSVGWPWEWGCVLASLLVGA